MSFEVFNELFMDMCEELDISEEEMEQALTRTFNRFHLTMDDFDIEESDIEESVSESDSESESESEFEEEDIIDIKGLQMNPPSFAYMTEYISSDQIDYVLDRLRERYCSVFITPLEIDQVLKEYNIVTSF